jgi:hypothetical protein
MNSRANGISCIFTTVTFCNTLLLAVHLNNYFGISLVVETINGVMNVLVDTIPTLLVAAKKKEKWLIENIELAPIATILTIWTSVVISAFKPNVKPVRRISSLELFLTVVVF